MSKIEKTMTRPTGVVGRYRGGGMCFIQINLLFAVEFHLSICIVQVLFIFDLEVSGLPFDECTTAPSLTLFTRMPNYLCYE